MNVTSIGLSLPYNKDFCDTSYKLKIELTENGCELVVCFTNKLSLFGALLGYPLF